MARHQPSRPEVLTAEPAHRSNLAQSPVPSPWLTAAEAAVYLKRGRRFILREIKNGRMRGAPVGDRGEVLTRAEWCDQWVEDRASLIDFRVRRRLG